MRRAKISDADALERSTSTASGPVVGDARLRIVQHFELARWYLSCTTGPLSMNRPVSAVASGR